MNEHRLYVLSYFLLEFQLVTSQSPVFAFRNPGRFHDSDPDQKALIPPNLRETAPMEKNHRKEPVDLTLHVLYLRFYELVLVMLPELELPRL